MFTNKNKKFYYKTDRRCSRIKKITKENPPLLAGDFRFFFAGIYKPNSVSSHRSLRVGG